MIEFSDAALSMSRFLIAFYALVQSVRLWRLVANNKRHVPRPVVPRPVVVFTAGWHTALAIISTPTALGLVSVDSSTWRALQGSALLGCLLGLSWMIWHGHRRIFEGFTSCEVQEAISESLRKSDEERYGV
jgi:hypothetical protein